MVALTKITYFLNLFTSYTEDILEILHVIWLPLYLFQFFFFFFFFLNKRIIIKKNYFKIIINKNEFKIIINHFKK